jgi:hypothetical protein
MNQLKPQVSFEKALRLLPSFVYHVAKGQTDLTSLRNRVQGEQKNLTLLLLEKCGETHSGHHITQEMLALDRKIQQLKNFMDQTER